LKENDADVHWLGNALYVVFNEKVSVIHTDLVGVGTIVPWLDYISCGRSKVSQASLLVYDSYAIRSEIRRVEETRSWPIMERLSTLLLC